jgi:hypothetical protein
MNLGSVQVSDIPATGIKAGEAQATTTSFGLAQSQHVRPAADGARTAHAILIRCSPNKC